VRTSENPSLGQCAEDGWFDSNVATPCADLMQQPDAATPRSDTTRFASKPAHDPEFEPPRFGGIPNRR
jgi:hypothetical protein